MTGIPLLFGPYGGIDAQTAAMVRQSGGNAAWFHGFRPEPFDICRSAGLEACVEYATFRANFEKRPELRPIGIDGQPIRHGRLVQGVCLSRREFLEEVEEGLGRGMASCEPRGVWLDYLTYAGWFETAEPDLQDSCFCSACIEEFCSAEGVDAASPSEIQARHRELWTEHKCRRVAGHAARYARIIRASNPGCLVGAYMCPYAPDELDGALSRIFAQDYGMLAEAVDIFTPLIYAQKSGRDAGWGREFLERSPAFVPAGRKVQLILDALDFPASLQETARSILPTWGVQLFAGATVFREEDGGARFRDAVSAIGGKAEGG